MEQPIENGSGSSTTEKSNGVAAAPPPAEVKPSLPPITDEDEDDIPIGHYAGRSVTPKAESTTSTTPKPAPTTPKPAAPKAAATTPKAPATTPAKAASKPAATTPKPAATTPKPAPATVKPAASPTAKPAATPSKPAATTPSTAKPAATSTTTAKPAAATPKAAATAKPASTTPKPAASTAKPASSAATTATPKGDKIEKTTNTKTETTTTPKATSSTSTTVTTTTTETPTAASKVTVTNTLTTTTPNADDSDDDKPISSLSSTKKTEVIKKEKKDDDIVTTTKTTTVKKEVKKEDSAKKEVKKEEKKTPTKKPQKRKVETSSEEEDSSEEEKPKKKQPAKKKKVESDSDESDSDEPKKKAKKPKKEEKGGEVKKKGKKKEGDGPDEWKWWEEEALPNGKKWATLVHNGVMFAEPYIPHGVKFHYDGKPVNLSPEAEEVATFYAKYLETDHTKKEVFNTNFWKDFRTYLTADQKKTIKDFAKANFNHIHKYLVDQKELKANKTTEQKKAEKEEKEKLLQKYGFAVINGHKQKISNWAIEKPGLFLGRGAHPKTGLVKKRIEAEDITINIGHGVPAPEPPPGHKWAKVVHDDEVAWLAMWKENINNGFKYVWLHASSAVKGRSDMKKFETARKLKGHIDKIRKKYTKELDDEELEVRQRSTALYLIDRLALRVGNEKDDDTADTVGCCSLRVEHITLTEPASVTLDFLGKDSMRYHNTVDVQPKIFKNLCEFLYKGSKKSPKKPEDDLFDQLTTTSLNKYLKEFMENLSAKVFRTFNASLTLEKELAKMPDELMSATNDEKVLFYNRCNREVAILCNHQRTMSKGHNESMGKIDEKIAEFEKKKDKLNQQIAFLKGKGKKPVLSDSEESDDEDSTPKKATPKKPPPKKVKEEESTPKKRKKGDDEDDEGDFKETPKKKVKRALPDSIDKCKAAIERVDASINKWNIKKTEKDELKSVALTTSKINYIDPRITAAWAKKVNLPIEKLFSKSLREKFPWAMDVDEDFEF